MMREILSQGKGWRRVLLCELYGSQKPVSGSYGVRIFLRTLIVFPVFYAALVISACQSQPIDLRELLPRNTLVYLETSDLAAALNAITETESFKTSSAHNLDFSAVEGVRVAIAVTGLETDEKQVSDSRSILNLKPKFVAVADTNAWSYRVHSLVEDPVNRFVQKVFGEDVKLVKRLENNVQWYIWTAADGRRLFAAVVETQVFFGNDEESINQALSAKSGRAENLSKRSDLDTAYELSKNKLAFGFVSTEAIVKISELIGISVAVQQTEDENTRAFISRVLPGIISGTLDQIIWTARPVKAGIEDKLLLKTKAEFAVILNETIRPAANDQARIIKIIPPQAQSVTLYSIKNPQVAFRSILLVAAKNAGAAEGRLISTFSGSLLEPYGIENSEEFLSGAGTEIYTVQLDEEGEKSLVIAAVKDIEKIKSSVSPRIDFIAPPKTLFGAQIWNSADQTLSAAVLDRFLVLGESDGVLQVVANWRRMKSVPAETVNDFSRSFEKFRETDAASYTVAADSDAGQRMRRVFGVKNNGYKPIITWSFVETRYTKTGIERRYISDFGFIGMIVGQFDSE